MNKQQIIAPFVAFAILALLFSPFYIWRIRMQRRDTITWSAICVAKDLTITTNSALLVSNPPALKQQLLRFLTTPTDYADTFLFGDEPPPAGDGTATHRVYIRNGHDESIALRLKYDPGLKKFHLLGFWTNSWPEQHAP